MRVLLNRVSATAMVAFSTMALAACGGDASSSADSEAAASSSSVTSEAAAAVEETASNAIEAAQASTEEASDAAEQMNADASDAMENAANAAGDVAAGVQGAAANVETAAVETAAAVSEAASDVADKTANLTAEAADGAAGAASTVLASLAGDAAAGRRVFVKCMACHTVQEGQHRVGPSLYGIIGRPAGTIEGFNYSDANKNSGIVWTEDIMFEYLENPQEYMPGTRMIFPGLPSEQDRANVIAYLKSAAE